MTDSPPVFGDFSFSPRIGDAGQVSGLLRFESPITTSVRENNLVEAELYFPRDVARPIPVVVLLHYWGATDLQAEQRLARRLTDLGIGAAILTLPYHMRRSQPGVRSGQAALQPDPEALKTTMTQAVMDVRRLIDWLTANPEVDKNRIGLAGISLGGIVGALAAGVDHRISVAAFVLSGGDIAHMMFSSSVTVDVRRELRRKGITEEDLRSSLASIEPLNYARPAIGSSVLVVKARFDQVIPPEDAEKLAAAWNAQNVVTLETGHYGGALVERRLYRTISTFFDGKFSARDVRLPSKVNSPTIRIGLHYGHEHGLTVGAGLDLWKSKNRDSFATGLISATGPMLYVGREFRFGLSAGVTLAKSGLTVGLFWSMVL